MDSHQILDEKLEAYKKELLHEFNAFADKRGGSDVNALAEWACEILAVISFRIDLLASVTYKTK
jgi:hypothetical protein